MDMDTMVLLVATFAAFCWWFKLQLNDNKRLLKKLQREEADRTARAKRIKELMNR